MYYLNIFKDVIGPVMRGSSSSHCAAALRIGRAARELMGCKIRAVLIQFDTNGSLAMAHASQGSVLGFFSGLLAWNTTDERLVESPIAINTAGIKVDINIGDFGATHPNTYMLTLKNLSKTYKQVAISIWQKALQTGGACRLPGLSKTSWGWFGIQWRTGLKCLA